MQNPLEWLPNDSSNPSSWFCLIRCLSSVPQGHPRAGPFRTDFFAFLLTRGPPSSQRSDPWSSPRAPEGRVFSLSGFLSLGRETLSFLPIFLIFASREQVRYARSCHRSRKGRSVVTVGGLLLYPYSALIYIFSILGRVLPRKATPAESVGDHGAWSNI
jgi:hypothetical protein